MTDILDGTADLVFSDDPCQKDGCPNFLPLGHHVSRKYCDEHQPASSKPKSRKTDKPPTNVTVNLKTSAPKSKKGTSEEVKAGATSLLTLVSLGFTMAGDAECAGAISAQTPAIAAQLAELAEYHPGIAKIFAPVNAQGEAAAWIGLAMAMAPVVIAILAHHNLLSPSLAEKLGGLAGGLVIAQSVPSPPSGDEAPSSVADAA